MGAHQTLAKKLTNMTTIFDSLLKAQYEQVGTNLRTIWDIYIKFYTVFITVNFTALGLVIQYVDTDQRIVLVSSFVIQNLFSAATAVGMSAYSRFASDQQQAIINAHSIVDGTDTKSHPLAYLAPIPTKLTYWGGIANGLSHLLFIACWVASLYIKNG